jgi:ion channel-forming bestrophin family protein
MIAQTASSMRLVLRWQGSIAPKILPGILVCGGLGLLVSLLDYLDFPVSWKGFDIVITNVSYNLVLGLLLVFRTNTAYDRFWEGRKAWGTITASIRSLGHLIWVSIGEPEPTDRDKKISTLRLLSAFAIASKLHLRQQLVNEELEALVTQQQLTKLKAAKLVPLQLSVWIGNYLQRQYERKLVTPNQLASMNGLVNQLLEALTVCERISSTPVPLAYAIYLKRLLLIYCLSLPFQLVNTLHWWTSAIAIILSFVLLGIEEIGTEIENPFGDDVNDLPLDEFCTTVLDDIENLIELNSQTNPEMELISQSS